MAARFYSVVEGEGAPFQVTEGASTSGEGVELRIEDTEYANKLDIMIRLRAILAYLETVETEPVA